VRVTIDARSAVEPHSTGIGRYARALLRYLPRAAPQADFVAWYLDVRATGRRPHRFDGWSPNLSEHATRIPDRLFDPILARLGVPKLDWFVGRRDVVVAPNFVPPPMSSEALVMVVHDLAFELLPETAPGRDDGWRRSFRRWLRTASAVIVPSEATRGDLRQLTDVDDGIVHVIPHGTDPEAFSPVGGIPIEELRRRFEITGPYVFFLGSLEPRKNVETLVRAMALIEDPRVTLVIAGGPVRWASGYGERVDRAIAELVPARRSRVVRIGYVSDIDRRALLSGAEVFAFPSLYEGFGLPILEAFAANVPVLTSDVGAAREVAGNAAVLVDPRDPVAVARGLDDLLADDDLRNVLRASGTARVASFTWERCARATANVLTEVGTSSR
jgi:glycosyltransferase involved in cell wall biosynthesis